MDKDELIHSLEKEIEELEKEIKFFRGERDEWKRRALNPNNFLEASRKITIS